jgi:hypothetical protein
MALKADSSILIGLATAAVVYGIYQINLPNTASIRASQSNNQSIESQRMAATWEAAAVVGGVSILAHDPTVFVIGGAVVILLDFTNRHANATNPVSGKVEGSASAGGVSASAGVTG